MFDTSNLRLVSAGTGEPITLEEARQHVRVDGDTTSESIDLPEDKLLPIYITAAREHAENCTGLILTDALYELRVVVRQAEGFCHYGDAIELPVAPVAEVVSIEYQSQDGTDQHLDATSFVFDDHPRRPSVRPVYGQAWPRTRDWLSPIRIRFRGAYTTSDSPPVPVPAAIKQAMLMLVGHWYGNREAAVLAGQQLFEAPLAVTALLNLQRRDMGV